jgi:hypothetical protein
MGSTPATADVKFDPDERGWHRLASRDQSHRLGRRGFDDYLQLTYPAESHFRKQLLDCKAPLDSMKLVLDIILYSLRVSVPWLDCLGDNATTLLVV